MCCDQNDRIEWIDMNLTRPLIPFDLCHGLSVLY